MRDSEAGKRSAIYVLSSPYEHGLFDSRSHRPMEARQPRCVRPTMGEAAGDPANGRTPPKANPELFRSVHRAPRQIPQIDCLLSLCSLWSRAGLADSGDPDCVHGDLIGERGGDTAFDVGFKSVQLLEVERMVAVEVNGDSETNSVHTLIARRLCRACTRHARSRAREGRDRRRRAGAE